MYAKVYCVGRDKKNYGLSFPLEIVKTEELQEDNSKRTSEELEQNHQKPQRAGEEEYLFWKHCQEQKLTQ